MQTTKSQLLDNLLDCLDRLFDGETNVIDVHDLVYATLAALSKTAHAAVLSTAQTELMVIATLRTSQEQQRDAALNATDELRKYVASVLPSPDSFGRRATD